MSEPPTRSRLDLTGDIVFGAIFGACPGFVFVLLGYLPVALTVGNDLPPDPSFTLERVSALYIFGTASAGAVAGLLRPRLATFLGRAFLTFAATFLLYGGAGLAVEETFTGSMIVDGLLLAAIATPFWLIGMKFTGADEQLAQYARRE